jgi:uncharacterized protein YggE
MRATRIIAGMVFVGLAASGIERAVAATDNLMVLRTVVVSGEATVSAQPDQARLTAGVVTQAVTATAALAANSAAMANVFATLKAAGIPEAKIRTSNFSVQPQYPPNRPDNLQPHTIIGYQISNQVTVVVDDLAKVGATMDALVKSGANQVSGIAFAITDTKPLAEKARTAAVADGMTKARTLAAAAGVTLGPLQSIQEGNAIRPGPVFAAAVGVPFGAPPPPIAAGEQNITVNVTMTYAIQ